MQFKGYQVAITHKILTNNILGIMICDHVRKVATISVERLVQDSIKKAVINALLDKITEGEENAMVFVEDVV